MMKWSTQQLEEIAAAEGFHVAPLRADGVSYRSPTYIWFVVVGESIYVRAYGGQNARWYRAARQQKAGRISAAGKTFEVSFAPADNAANDLIDAAYRKKYAGSAYLSAMISGRSRAASLEVLPHAP